MIRDGERGCEVTAKREPLMSSLSKKMAEALDKSADIACSLEEAADHIVGTEPCEPGGPLAGEVPVSGVLAAANRQMDRIHQNLSRISNATGRIRGEMAVPMQPRPAPGR